MDLSIIIVNWNSKDFLMKCLASIAARTSGVDFEVIVIDSGSFDGCDEMLHEHYPHTRFIQSTLNLGFARANNCAAHAASGDYLLFLNPDTELIGPAINQLLEKTRSLPDAAAVGGRLLNSDRTTQSSCIQPIPTILNRLLDSELLKRLWPASPLWGAAALYRDATDPQEVEAISGACLMVRREVFASVGGFTEDYFMYAEDVDLAYKVRKRGYKNYYVPGATLIHHGGSSSELASNTFAAVMIPEATFRFLRKTRGYAYGLAYRMAMCASGLGRLLLLGLSQPIWTRYRSRASWKASCDKWLAVLWWSLRRDGLVKQYYSAR
jgi:GT2 family glycosyltransferase